MTEEDISDAQRDDLRSCEERNCEERKEDVDHGKDKDQRHLRNRFWNFNSSTVLNGSLGD